MPKSKSTRMLGKLSRTILLFGILIASCKGGPTNSELPEIESGISQEHANKLVGVARIKATELGYNLEDLNYSVTRVKEDTLYVPYHSPMMLEKLNEAVKREKELFEVMFSRKPLKNGGVRWGGGLSVYMNQKGEIVAVQPSM